MSIPPKKPSDPFKRDPYGRLDSKGSPDGPGGNQGNASGSSSSSSSSSSTSSVPAPKHAGEDGYDSSTDPDDLPKNYYEIMSRERDRKKNKSNENRKLNRYMAANGWPQDGPVSPATFVRGYGFQYSQEGPYCNIVCAVFIQRRFFGEDVSSVIRGLHWLQPDYEIPQWHKYYKSKESSNRGEIPMRIKNGYFGGTLASFNLHTLITKSIKQHHARLYSSNRTAINPTANPEFSGQPRFDYQFYEQAIGVLFPDSDPSDQGSLYHVPPDASHDSGGLPTSSHVPLSRKATGSIQQALFREMQPSRQHGLPYLSPGNADAKPATMMRCATPFVVVSLTFFDPTGKQVHHEIVVDFSDPARPGIFDPNFGWMEPVQGFCLLTLEMALTSLWQYYSSQRMGVGVGSYSNTRMAGLYWLDRGPTDNDKKHPTRVSSGSRHIASSQIYVDITPIPTSPVPASKKPPLKS